MIDAVYVDCTIVENIQYCEITEKMIIPESVERINQMIQRINLAKANFQQVTST